MSDQPIRFHDRYRQTLETEQIYGERWLRFVYENPAGRFFLWLLVRRAVFSRFYGWRMNQKASARQVLPFIVRYNLDVDEFAKSAFLYRTFNEFFCRTLKPAARPIMGGDNTAVLPADGRHLVFPNVDTAEGFYVKGAKFLRRELLGDTALAQTFAGGAMLISRLAPVDYHRFHFPCAGVPGEARLINGWLYSVNPLALRRNIRYLVQNKRYVTLLESPVFGTVAMVEVGATNVGRVTQTHVTGRAVAKGEEKGVFAFGGSCVITLFQAGRIAFYGDLVEQSAQNIETYARMGDWLGEAPA
ncbi:MAG TPA: archaetidylserine decarboxylase [Opitutaceae bacterium]|jgi:phosphatidylserine decarboxylase|nr:archaetidylserine decarboxylase [Opitutaceae bacterium]